MERTKLRSGDKPVYPSIARLAQVEGVVRVRTTIATDGTTKDLEYLSGPPILMLAAMNSIRTWRFEPAVANGVPVEVETVAEVDFFLAGHDPQTILANDARHAESKPDDPKAHGEFAYDLLRFGEINQSITEFQKAISLQPREARWHFGLGSAFRANDDAQNGIEEYRQGLSLQPKDVMARSDFAALLESAGDLDGAIAQYRIILQDDPRNPAAHSSLGVALLKKNDFDSAITELHHAIHEGFGTAEIHYHLGLAFEKKGDFPAALKEYKTAASDSPQNDKYREARDRVAAKLHS